MEIRNLTTFLKVAEVRHFTHAAEELGYVQSTVTMQIQQLESEIGLPLFERIGKKVMLTSTGAELVIYANKIVGLCTQAREVGKTDAQVTGTLRIGVVESLYVTYVEPLLLHYYQLFPNVQISVRMGSGRDLMKRLAENELDLIFVLDNSLSEVELIPVMARQEQMVFVTSPAHLMCQERNISLLRITKEDLILTERQSIYRDALEQMALMQALEVTPCIEANNTSAIIRLLKKQTAISFLPEYAVQSSIAEGSLSILDVAMEENIEFWCQLLRHRNKWISRPMQGFIDLLHEKLHPS